LYPFILAEAPYQYITGVERAYIQQTVQKGKEKREAD
jgi:hypothetical protein